MIYFNNAATGYPKPAAAVRAVEQALTGLPEGQFRSVVQEGEAIPRLREKMALLLGVSDPSRIFFTSGATEAMNMVIRGLDLQRRRVLATAAEHNCVLRPLYNGGAGSVGIIPCREDGHADLGAYREMLAQKPAAVFVNHCSNVTGAVQDLRLFSELAHRAGAVLIADLSQSAGAIPLDLQTAGADIAVFTGHKGLWGPQGTGGFYIRQGLRLRPLLYGGTGSDSQRLVYDESWEGYEVGTQNGPGLAGLLAGVSELLAIGVEEVQKKESRQMNSLCRRLKELPNLELYVPETPEGPLLSLNIRHMTPQDVGYILSRGYHIVTRAGWHCAPLMKVHPQGSVRISLSYFTKDQELDALVRALNEIGGGRPLA